MTILAFTLSTRQSGAAPSRSSFLDLRFGGDYEDSSVADIRQASTAVVQATHYDALLHASRARRPWAALENLESLNAAIQ